jgi:uncharacterized protein YndB with AHSA1/START domain
VTETLHSVDGRSVLRIERWLGHPPEKVWRALTEPAQISRWFPADMEMDVTAGGKIRFVFRGGEGPTTDGVINELDPPRVFAFTWGDDVLHWELREDGRGCILIFTHTFDDRAGAASFASGWQVCLDALDAVVDGRPVEAAGPSAEAHEGYVDRFGLGEGTTEDTPDGWLIRFERQLTRPIEVVWAALAESGHVGPHVPDGGPVVGGPVPPEFTIEPVPPGTVTEVEAPTVLEYEWHSAGRPAGRVRWELRNGTGHGARLVLSQTGPDELTDKRATALVAWRAYIRSLARRMADASG